MKIWIVVTVCNYLIASWIKMKGQFGPVYVHYDLTKMEQKWAWQKSM